MLAVGVTGFQSYYRARQALEQAIFNSLTVSREIKKRQIEEYFSRIRNQVISLSENPMFVRTAQDLNRAEPAVLDKWARQHDDVLKSFIERFEFVDLTLVRLRDSRVIYSVQHDVSHARSLGENPWNSNGLAEVCESLKHQHYLVSMTDFQMDPENGMPTAFVASSVRGDSMVRPWAVLAFRIPIHRINELMTGGRNWEKEGFGKTGETYLVGRDFRMRSDSRFVVEDFERFMKQISLIPGSDVDGIRRSKSTIMRLKAETEATRMALSGVSDTRIIRDYRDVPVLSSFSPLRIKGLQWVMVSEIDTAEAFEPIQELRDFLFFAGMILSVVFAACGAVLSRRISRPIIALAQAANRLERGDLGVKINIRGTDEIAELGTAFNQMAVSLQAEHLARRDLEGKIVDVAENERHRIGQELHDGLAQHLLGAGYYCRSLVSASRSGKHPTEESLEKLTQWLDEAVKITKDTARGLSPVSIDVQGIHSAIEELISRSSAMYKVRCSLGGDASIEIRDGRMALHIYRIIQEALSNALQHAQASRIEVRYGIDKDGFLLEIMDDGVGIADKALIAQSPGLGIRIMQIRACAIGLDLVIKRLDEKGTIVRGRIKGDSVGKYFYRR